MFKHDLNYINKGWTNLIMNKYCLHFIFYSNSFNKVNRIFLDIYILLLYCFYDFIDLKQSKTVQPAINCMRIIGGEMYQRTSGKIKNIEGDGGPESVYWANQWYRTNHLLSEKLRFKSLQNFNVLSSQLENLTNLSYELAIPLVQETWCHILR